MFSTTDGSYGPRFFGERTLGDTVYKEESLNASLIPGEMSATDRPTDLGYLLGYDDEPALGPEVLLAIYRGLRWINGRKWASGGAD